MPLLDHFRGELADRRHWESFHAAWATTIMMHLNAKVLPPDYFAEAQVTLSRKIEVDVATLEEARRPPSMEGNGGVAVQTWAPPTTAMQIPATYPDDIEVQIIHQMGGLNLVAAIELVSPGNKDRPEARRAFAAKCAAYLQRGIGLVVIDVVTERHANLHDELIELLGQPSQFAYPSDSVLYAVAYRPTRRDDVNLLETWPYDLAVGQPLPTVPLPLRRGPTLPLELETTYTTTRAGSRL
jgi:hypothetical protein